MKNQKITNYYRQSKISAGLVKTIEAAERGEFQVTYVINVKRISEDTAVQRDVLSYFTKLGVKVMDATANKPLN